MTEDYSEELTQQLQLIRTTLESVSSLQQEIKNVGDELKNTGRLNESGLRQVGEMASTATAALNNLASAAGFLDELRKTSGPTVKQLTQSLHEFQQVLTQSVQDLTSGVSSLPHVLKSLEATSDTLDSQVRKQTTDLFTLIESVTNFVKSSEEGSATVERLYLAAPGALIGTLFGMILLDVSLLQAVAWTTLTLSLVVAGFPGRRVITDTWTRLRSLGKNR